MSNKHIVVLISGNGSNLQAIIDDINTHNIKATIAAVISNKANAYGLKRASLAGIETHIIDHTHYATRTLFDQSLMEVIDQYHPHIIILAGFMRILTSDFVTNYSGKLINIHPSLLPLYRGLDTHKRALEGGATQHGASVHFVTPELDAGAVLIQGLVAVKESDDEQTLSSRVHQIEHIIYPQAVKLLVNNHIELKADRIYINNQYLQQPKQYRLENN